MTNTIPLTTALSANGDTAAVQVEGGQYLLALGGAFGGGTVQVKVNIGNVAGAPVNGAAYTAATAEIIWLPRCTVYLTLSGATAPNINAAMAELSTRLEK